MNVFATYLAFRQLQRSQWLDRNSLQRLQEHKLQRLVEHAYYTVPYYRKRFDEAGITPQNIRSLADLSRIPITSKADLQTARAETITSSKHPPETLISEHTSGSSGRPFTARFDPHFAQVRNGLFLRALMTVGYRVGQKLLLVTTRPQTSLGRWFRWRYVSIEDTPKQILTAVNQFRPHVLYGCMSPLRQLAAYVRAEGIAIHRPKLLVSTAETLDEATHRLLGETFGARVYDFYGLTEMGIVGWPCTERRGYHIAEDCVIVELRPAATAGNISSVVMTNLELSAMPYIRFDTGDLATPESGTLCACGRSLLRLERLEGRSIDCIKLRDGRTVSPYQVIHALGHIRGVERYQVIQEDFHTFAVRLEGEAGSEVIRRAIRRVVGNNVKVRVDKGKSLDPPPGQKFRLVECRIDCDEFR
jgi:phenylacetate-CoA ligase